MPIVVQVVAVAIHHRRKFIFIHLFIEHFTCFSQLAVIFCLFYFLPLLSRTINCLFVILLSCYFNEKNGREICIFFLVKKIENNIAHQMKQFLLSNYT